MPGLTMILMTTSSPLPLTLLLSLVPGPATMGRPRPRPRSLRNARRWWRRTMRLSQFPSLPAQLSGARRFRSRGTTRLSGQPSLLPQPRQARLAQRLAQRWELMVGHLHGRRQSAAPILATLARPLKWHQQLHSSEGLSGKLRIHHWPPPPSPWSPLLAAWRHRRGRVTSVRPLPWLRWAAASGLQGHSLPKAHEPLSHLCWRPG